jgi:hypothetical protein
MRDHFCHVAGVSNSGNQQQLMSHSAVEWQGLAPGAARKRLRFASAMRAPAPDGRMFREPWRKVGREDWRIDAERR